MLNYSSKCLINTNHYRAWNEGSRVLWSHIHRRGEGQRVLHVVWRIPERWSLGDRRWRSCSAGPPSGSAVKASERAWLTAYTGQVPLKDRILPSLTRHMLPCHVPFVPEPHPQRELGPAVDVEDRAGGGRGGPSPAEWRPARCWHGALWWPCAVARGKRRAPGQRSCPLSSGAPPCHLVQCSSPPGSMLRKGKSE